MDDSKGNLTRLERAALALGRFTNERPAAKAIQQRYVRMISQSWIFHTVARRTYVDNIDWLRDFEPDRGVVMCSNHRSFFDQYVMMLTLYECGVEWPQRLYFPVRSNFFYERPLGMFVNFTVGGGAMYPPIFRDPAKSAYNKDALSRVTEVLSEPGVIVGMHPEGTRGKGPDPYEVLPAQAGVGQVVLRSKPIVIPMFCNGLRNNLLTESIKNYKSSMRRERPVILTFGKPIDYSEFTVKKPRMALYKRCADKIREEIVKLADREREVRAACERGEIADDDPNWLVNRRANRT
jgi:1-acyl-sn-glycerol-3-phosphate acyltransferase